MSLSSALEMHVPGGSLARSRASEPGATARQSMESVPCPPKVGRSVRLALLAPLAVEAVVRVAQRVLLEREEVLQVGRGEVPLDVRLLVHDAAAERLLVRLALERGDT